MVGNRMTPVPLRRIVFILLVIPMGIFSLLGCPVGALIGYLVKGTDGAEDGQAWLGEHCFHNAGNCGYHGEKCRCGIRSVYDWAHNPIEKPKTADKIAAIEADLKAIDREIEAAR